MPIRTKFRRRLCHDCKTALAGKGYICPKGRDVQDMCDVPHGGCGLVTRPAGTLPPPASKFQGFRDLKRRLYVKIGAEKKKAIDHTYLNFVAVEEKERTRCLLVGGAIAGAAPFVTCSNLYNALKAVLCRVFRAPKHIANPRYWAVVRRFDHIFLAGMFSVVIEKMSRADWIAEAEARRKPALLRASRELDELYWHEKFEWFGSFLKSEKLPGFEQFVIAMVLLVLIAVVDRLIQGPHDATHLIAGPMLRPTTTRLKEVWSYQGPIFYAAVAISKLDSWFNERYHDGMWGVMCDYTMFDNSHSDLSWDWVESIYRRLGFFEEDSRFGKVMQAWRAPKGRLTGMGWMLEYRAYVMNASGRDDTSLANALLNGAGMLLALAAVFAHKSVPQLEEADVHAVLQKAHISICGDDSLVLLEYLPCPGDVFCTNLEAELAGFGFTAGADKMKISQNPFDFVYLGNRPYPVDGRWYFAKTIGRAMWKFGWRMDPDGGDNAAWMAGNCRQVVQTQQVVPLLYDVAQAYLAQHQGPVSIMRPDVNKPWQERSSTPPYDAKVIRYLAEGYGVTVQEFEACVQYVRAQRVFPCVLDHPVLTTICCLDEM